MSRWYRDELRRHWRVRHTDWTMLLFQLVHVHLDGRSQERFAARTIRVPALLQEFVIGVAARQAVSYQSQQSIGSGRNTVLPCSNQRRFQLVRLDGSHRDIERRGNLLCRV